MSTTRVPTTGYERWKELQLNFDAREMLEVKITYEKNYIFIIIYISSN